MSGPDICGAFALAVLVIITLWVERPRSTPPTTTQPSEQDQIEFWANWPDHDRPGF